MLSNAATISVVLIDVRLLVLRRMTEGCLHHVCRTSTAARWCAATGLVHGAATIALRKDLGLLANMPRHGLPLPPFHGWPGVDGGPRTEDANARVVAVAVGCLDGISSAVVGDRGFVHRRPASAGSS